MENTNIKGSSKDPDVKREVIDIVDFSIVFGSPSYSNPEVVEPEFDKEEKIKRVSQKMAEAGKERGVKESRNKPNPLDPGETAKRHIMEMFTEGLDKEPGIKQSKGKLFHELDFNFIKQMSERMSSNKTNSKYPVWNWKKGMDEEELRMAVFRHVLEIMEGNYEDDGRPLGHIEALATNAMMLNYQAKKNKE